MKSNESFEKLRKRAECVIPKVQTDISKLSSAEIKEVVQNLEVYQIELEMQNDELVLAQNELKSINEKYFDLFEFAPIGYLQLSSELKITDANTTFCKLLSVEKKDILNLAFTNFIASDFQNDFYLNYKSKFKNSAFEILLTNENNKKRWFKTEIIYNPDLDLYRVSLSDIQQQKEKEIILEEYTHKLEIANSTKDKLFSIIAHDLKSPFTSILGFSSLLNQNFRNYSLEKIAKMLFNLNQASEKVYNLLEDLLTWSMSQSNAINIVLKKENLSEIISRTINQVSSSAEKKEIIIKTNLEKNCYAKIDSQSISMVLRNLMNNAIKFTHRGGLLEISCSTNEKFIELSIKDNGIGISKENLSKIFLIGQQSSSEGTENEKGTGLGLVICNDFIKKNNGQIEIESELNVGSIFKIILPKNI